MNSYDKVYRGSLSYFGDEPTSILREYVLHIDKLKPVLDIGAGQGRNTFFLARNGFTVEALEPSGEGIKQIQEIAEIEKLNITAIKNGFENFCPQSTPYSAILLFGILQILSWEQIHSLIGKINKWTAEDSYIFLSAFSTADFSYLQGISVIQEAGKNSFLTINGEYRTFLEPNEILTLFRNFQPLHHWEGLGPLHQHGRGEQHRHGLIHFVGKRIS